MAEVRLQPPDPFNFRNPDDWPRWKRRFQQFRDASGLSEGPAQKQVSTFLYCLGEEAESVLASTNATEADRADYTRVLEKFDAFFKVRKNVIYERARFNRRTQQSGETAEQFIMTLYDLAEHCEYGDMKDEMIRDRLVVGIRDSALSEKLQLDSVLTLESAKKAIRQREAVREQQQTLKHGDSTTNGSSVENVRFKQQARGNRYGRGQRRDRVRNSQPKPSTHAPSTAKCGRCGGEQHPRAKCPAKEAECHNCKIKGHFSAVCRKKTVSTVEADPTNSAFLDTLAANDGRCWTSDLTIDRKQITFKIDTGAEVTAITKRTWQVLEEPALQPPNKHLFGPAKQPLKSLGAFTRDLHHKCKHSQQQIFVVDDLKHNLLGLPAIIALQLVTRLESIQGEKPAEYNTWLKRFPKVFQGLGKLSGEYNIQLRPDAKPHAVYTPRHIPLPLRPQVAEELQRMEEAGVISKVTELPPGVLGWLSFQRRMARCEFASTSNPSTKVYLERYTHSLKWMRH